MVSALFAARMTALSKKDGSVRGIATGHAFRRLLARTLARQFMPQVEAACSPYQFALSIRAGTDCVGHAIRLATDLDARLTVLSIDGVGAYDHVLRQAMLSGLNAVPEARGMLPFVRMAYASLSRYAWEDGGGVLRFVEQAEGEEQGDPLMPMLFFLAVHEALDRA